MLLNKKKLTGTTTLEYSQPGSNVNEDVTQYFWF